MSRLPTETEMAATAFAEGVAACLRGDGPISGYLPDTELDDAWTDGYYSVADEHGHDRP
jgi:hypothetical protein